MCLLKLKSQRFALAVIPLLCLMAGNTGANDDLTWPVESDLVYNDGDIAHVFHDAGDVSILNTKDDIKIAITPGEGLKLSEVSIHIVQDPADFASILDKKSGKPKVSISTLACASGSSSSIRPCHRSSINEAGMKSFSGS